MAATREVGNHVGAHCAFHLEQTAKREGPRFIDGFLRVQATRDKVRDQLSMTDCLVLSTHDAERHPWCPIRLANKTRNNRVQWPFARINTIWMPIIETEPESPVMQKYARTRLVYSAAEAMEQRIDK